MSFEEIPYCEVFHPTNQEFSDFAGYLEKITRISKSGIFKVYQSFLINIGYSSKRMESKER